LQNIPLQAIIDQYGSMLFRISLTLLKNSYDAEDALQETFLRYLTRAPEFHDASHRKAWLIRVIINISKDMLRYRSRHEYIPYDELIGEDKDSPHYGILEEVMALPLIYREVVLLYYVEEYPIREAAAILSVPETTVKKRLQYAREKLRLACDEQYPELPRDEE